MRISPTRLIMVKSAAANLALPASAILTGPLLARSLGPSDRGYYAALTAPAFFWGIIGTLGLQDALTRFCAERGLTVQRAFIVAIRLLPALAAIAAIVLTAASPWMLSGLSSRTSSLVFIVVSAWIFIALNLVGGISVGAARFGVFNLNRLLVSGIRIVGIGGLFLVGRLSLMGSVAIFALSGLLSLVVMSWQLQRSSPTPLPGHPHTAGAPVTRQIVAYALLLLPGVIATIGLSRLDQVLGLGLIGPRELGYYAVAASVAEAPLALSLAIRMYYMGRPATNDDSPLAREYMRLILAVGAGGLSIALVIAGASPFAIPWLFGQEYAPAVAPTVILGFSTVFLAMYTTGTGLLIRHGYANSQTLVVFVALAINIIGLFAFARWGAAGVSWASFTAYSVAAVATLSMIQARFAPARIRENAAAESPRAGT